MVLRYKYQNKLSFLATHSQFDLKIANRLVAVPLAAATATATATAMATATH